MGCKSAAQNRISNCLEEKIVSSYNEKNNGNLLSVASTKAIALETVEIDGQKLFRIHYEPVKAYDFPTQIQYLDQECNVIHQYTSGGITGGEKFTKEVKTLAVNWVNDGKIVAFSQFFNSNRKFLLHKSFAKSSSDLFKNASVFQMSWNKGLEILDSKNKVSKTFKIIPQKAGFYNVESKTFEPTNQEEYSNAFIFEMDKEIWMISFEDVRNFKIYQLNAINKPTSFEKIYDLSLSLY